MRKFFLSNVRSMVLEDEATLDAAEGMDLRHLDLVVLSPSSHWTGRDLKLNTTNLTVSAGASINADGRGHPGKSTSEVGFGCDRGGHSYHRSRWGGAHGGKGGRGNLNYAGSSCASGQKTHGDKDAPTSMGGGASGGIRGGGVIRVDVSGELTMLGTARISSDGQNGGSNMAGAAHLLRWMTISARA